MIDDHTQARVDHMRSQGMSYWEIGNILNREKLEHEVQQAQTVEDLKQVILKLIHKVY